MTKDQAWVKLAEIVSPEIAGYHLVNNKQKVIDDLIADAQANRHTVYTVYYTRDQQPTPTPSETPVTPETTGNKTATPVGRPLTVQTGRSALVSATTKAGGFSSPIATNGDASRTGEHAGLRRSNAHHAAWSLGN